MCHLREKIGSRITFRQANISWPCPDLSVTRLHVRDATEYTRHAGRRALKIILAMSQHVQLHQGQHGPQGEAQ